MRLLLGAALFVTLFATPAHAWNEHGHFVVAEAAWRQLDGRSRERVSALLKLNPDYPKWIEGVPAVDRDEVAFLRASVWADDIRSEKDYRTTPTTE